MLRLMDDKIERIAATARFRELYDAGWSQHRLATHYRVHTSIIKAVIERLQLPPRLPTANWDIAPDIHEEAASMDSLRLAPLVAAKAEEVKRRHFEQRRREPESTTQCSIARRRRRELSKCQE